MEKECHFTLPLKLKHSTYIDFPNNTADDVGKKAPMKGFK